MEKLIDENIRLMDSANPGRLIYLLQTESCGSRGKINGKSFITAKFYYTQDEGKIFYFGLAHEAPENIRKKCVTGDFKVSINNGFVIEDYGLDKNASEENHRVIRASIGRWNGRAM